MLHWNNSRIWCYNALNWQADQTGKAQIWPEQAPPAPQASQQRIQLYESFILIDGHDSPLSILLY